MSQEKFRLVTRSDFDGLVCAVLLNELELIDDIKFVHPKDMQDGKIDITSAAAGDDHLVNVSAATSAAWVAGDYDLLGVVTKAAERYTVSTGRVTIKPNLAALTTYDGRTPERIALEALQSAYIDYLSNNQGHVAEYEIAGRRMKFRNAAEIWQQIERLKIEVKKQDDAAAMAAGLKPKRRLLVRFN